MELKQIKLLNHYTNEIRNKMNEIIEEIDNDFTDWCELGTMLMYRLIKEKFPNADNKAVLGFYNGNGHFWNEINGVIVDTTVDQFGKIKVGVVNKKWLKNYKIKEYKRWHEEDLIHMTQSVYDYLYVI